MTLSHRVWETWFFDSTQKTPNHTTLDIEILDGLETTTHQATDICIYTDGSKIDTDRKWGTGAGYTISDRTRTIASKHITLCHTKTVFQAEVIAIQMSLKTFKEEIDAGNIPPSASATFFTDSQSALQALSSTYTSSRKVQECLDTIRLIQATNKLNFVWIKAHNGNKGNEIADALAKMGAMENRLIKGPGPFHSVPPSFVKQQLFLWALAEWNRWWHESQPCRQTKDFFPEADLHRSKKVLNNDRIDVGLLIRWMSGHNFLRYHRSLIDKTGETSSSCRLCHGASETSRHILFDCPELHDERNLVLSVKQGEQVDPKLIPIDRLLEFLRTYADVFEESSDSAAELNNS